MIDHVLEMTISTMTVATTMAIGTTRRTTLNIENDQGLEMMIHIGLMIMLPREDPEEEKGPGHMMIMKQWMYIVLGLEIILEENVRGQNLETILNLVMMLHRLGGAKTWKIDLDQETMN